jgi:hypothetical protein
MQKAISGMMVSLMAVVLMGCVPSDEPLTVETEVDEVRYEIEVDRKQGYGNTWEIEVPKFNE